jgi:hypothetical protein
MTSPYRPGPSRRIPLQNSFAKEFCNAYAGLPPAITARHWPLVWAGLDGAIAVGLGACAWLAGRRDQRVVPVSAATATLMAADAWFDICTSPAGRPLVLALAGLAVEAAVATVCLLLGRAARPGALTKIAETPGGSAHP